MTDPDWLAEIESMIYKSWEGMHWGTYEAAKLGDEGEPILLRAVRQGNSYVQSAAARHLFRFSGPDSLAILRERARVTGKGSEQVRVEALCALAHRLGDSVEADLLEALRDPASRPRVKDTATDLLALWGTGSGWEEAFTHTRKRARVTARYSHSEDLGPIPGIQFLMRFCAVDDARTPAVVSMVRTVWVQFDDRNVEWFAKRWPQVMPGGPAPRDVAAPDFAAEIDALRSEAVSKQKLKPPPVWTHDPFDRDKWPG